MGYRSILIIALISGNIVYSQQNDCKVLKPEISDSYSGGCKNGLAEGKGVARGIDYYEGQFNKGMPAGKGTYYWADGTYYEALGERQQGRLRQDGLQDSQSPVTGRMIYMPVKSLSRPMK
jgi:hypothetical protein